MFGEDVETIILIYRRIFSTMLPNDHSFHVVDAHPPFLLSMEPIVKEGDEEAFSSQRSKRFIWGIVCILFAVVMTGVLFGTPRTLVSTSFRKSTSLATKLWTPSQAKNDSFPKEVAISYFTRQSQRRFSKLRLHRSTE